MQKGPGDYMVVTSSFSLFQLKLLPVVREVFEDILKIGRFWAGDGVIEVADPDTGQFTADRSSGRMWARIILRSAMSRGGLESMTANAAWLDEAGQAGFSLDSWEAILRRLSLSRGRVLITTTLYSNTGWLRRQYERWKAGDRDYDVIQFRSTINPAFSTEELQRAESSMQRYRYLMMYEGEYSNPPGQVYELTDGHLVEPFPIPRTWKCYAGVDFGAVNTAIVWLAHDEDHDVYYLYREYLEGSKTTHQHCQDVLGLTKNENMVAWFGGAPSEVQQRRDWLNEEVPVNRPPVSDIEAGIDRVTHLLRTRRLRVFNTLQGVRQEFETYSREMDDDGNVYEAIRNKESYHRLDALRYVCAGIVIASIKTAKSIWD
jgi:hypothetical protein